MRLWELFSDLGEKSLPAVEKDLDSEVYQPAAKVAKGKEPVIDLDLLSSPHFIQRIGDRAKSAALSTDEIENLFRAGREQHKAEIGRAARQDDFMNSGEHIDFMDPETKLFVPTIVKPNPACKPNSRGKITCQTPNGPEPKNRLVAKSIMRKGTRD